MPRHRPGFDSLLGHVQAWIRCTALVAVPVFREGRYTRCRLRMHAFKIMHGLGRTCLGVQAKVYGSGDTQITRIGYCPPKTEISRLYQMGTVRENQKDGLLRNSPNKRNGKTTQHNNNDNTNNDLSQMAASKSWK